MTSKHFSEDSTQPLAGLVVLELGHSVAAPFAGHVLADLGAKVVKVEKPVSGDDTRAWGPPFVNGTACTFLALNRNKHSSVVDLKRSDDVAALKAFIQQEVDIVFQNMRPGAVEKVGLDAASLMGAKPALIYCNMWAFGAKGPMTDLPGYDPLMQAFGGIMSVTGQPGAEPSRAGPSMVDVGTGMWAVIGILSALQRRHNTGRGCVIDTSLFETSLSWMQSFAASYLATGKVPERRGSGHPTLAPYRVFSAADDYLMIAAGNDSLFGRLANALGHPEWVDDERMATNPQRVSNRDYVDRTLQEVIGLRLRDEWIAVLEAAGVPCAALQTLDQALGHPQTTALGMVQQTPDGSVSLLGLPLSFDGARPALRKPPPNLGDDTALISKYRS